MKMQEPLHFQGREFLFNGIISSIKIKQSPLSKIFALFLLLSTVSIARAQIDGICVCSPTIYQWSLNFTATCPPNNISQGRNAGISDSVCLIFAEQATVTDLVPVRTTTIQFFELNRNLEAINAVFRDGLSLVSGDTFRYTSIIASEPNPVSTRIPGGFQMRITSENANGDKIINDWIVAYTNSCEVEPFEGGGQDSLGWAVFENLSPPRPQLCPLVQTSPPTPEPSPRPSTTEPTETPILNPIARPTRPARPSSPPVQPVRPTTRPTNSRTESPTGNPTESPTANPTESPTANPTESQTANPTESPTESPTFKQPVRPPKPTSRPPRPENQPRPSPIPPSPEKQPRPSPIPPSPESRPKPPVRPPQSSMSYDYIRNKSEIWWRYRTPEKGDKNDDNKSLKSNKRKNSWKSKKTDKSAISSKKDKSAKSNKKDKFAKSNKTEKSSIMNKISSSRKGSDWTPPLSRKKRSKEDHKNNHWVHVWKWTWGWH